MDNYQIISSAAQPRAFKELCEQSRTEGRLSAAAESAKELVLRLQADPNTAGEMLYQLTHARLPVRHFVLSPWSVHFAVDDEGRLVYVKNFALLDAKQ